MPTNTRRDALRVFVFARSAAMPQPRQIKPDWRASGRACARAREYLSDCDSEQTVQFQSMQQAINMNKRASGDPCRVCMGRVPSQNRRLTFAFKFKKGGTTAQAPEKGRARSSKPLLHRLLPNQDQHHISAGNTCRMLASGHTGSCSRPSRAAATTTPPPFGLTR